MRWNSKYTLQTREGETRIVRKFLLLPRRFNSTSWRWFEYANIVECICKLDVGGSMEWGNYSWQWCEIGFEHDINIED